MGILTKEVKVKINNNNIEYYKNLGYEIPMREASKWTKEKNHKDFVYDVGAYIIVKVEDLQQGSHILVDVLCDYCNEEIVHIPYYRYINGLKTVNKTSCNNCKYKKVEEVNILKYGTSIPAKLDKVKEKAKQTNLLLYGEICYSKTQEYKNRVASTMKQRYGVEHPLQYKVFLDAFKNTCIERYGDNYGKYFSEKAFESYYNNTGYTNPLLNPEIKEKITKTLFEHYGVNSPFESLEIREKSAQTLYANSSQKSSKQQRYINNLYQGILNYPIKYYNVDIYLSNNNLIVEYDGGFHMGNVLSGHETQEEFDQKEIRRYYSIKREGYKQMRIISSKDLLPSDQILLQMLSEARKYFSDYPSHSWIEFNIDTSSVRNAENKDGVFYDYGELRRIKKSDIENLDENVDCA